MSQSTVELSSFSEEDLKDLEELAGRAGVPWDYVQDELKRGDDFDEIRKSLEGRAQMEEALADGLVPKWHSFYRSDGSMGRKPINKLAFAMEAEDKGTATDEQLRYLAEVRAELASRGR